jgi:hypothetical protein
MWEVAGAVLDVIVGVAVPADDRSPVVPRALAIAILAAALLGLAVLGVVIWHHQ